MLLTIVVTLFDNDGLALADYTDVMALDGGTKRRVRGKTRRIS